MAGRVDGVPGWRVALWGAVALLLLAPLAAMQLTREVAWTPFDFVAAAVLLGGAAAAVELAMRRIASRRGRIAAGAGIAVVLATIWLQGAVGLV